MQPLSYQILPASCWVTSVLNGLLVLYGDKNKIPGLVYRLLHAVLTDEGVHTTGAARDDWKIVLEAVESRTDLRFLTVQRDAVAPALAKLHFRRQVAICDIASGSHAILLNGRSKSWLEGFDPDWGNVRKPKSKAGAFEVFPVVRPHKLGLVNVRIDVDYLARAGRGKIGLFQMGAVRERTLTVIEKR